METLTFLFSDIEGSTRLWEQDPDSMRSALFFHNAVLSETIEANHGKVFKTLGDAFCAVFQEPAEAVAAALKVQITLLAGPWPTPASFKVRIAIHTGEYILENGDYFGPTLNLVARLLGVERAGHIILSSSTASLVRDTLPEGASLQDLGQHMLRDLASPVGIYHVVHPVLPQEHPIYRSPKASQHNLPLELTPFVGREQERKEIRELLSRVRLVTLLGSGGVGKTRLALKVAAETLENYRDGAWLVELAPVTNHEFVPRAAASVLRVREEPNQSLTETLCEHLCSKKTLVVLDNCEQVAAACAELVESLLRACPHVQVLATSREPLGIEGEAGWRVPCLALPNSENASSEDMAQCEAVRLFVERAQSARPSFVLDKQNARSVAEICSRLDGIPLAIELAAAHTRILSVKQISEKLKNEFQLLTGGNRTALPRHRTMRAAIDWSYQLITEKEKIAFRRLSVFVGGFKLDAAAATCVGNGIKENGFLQVLSGLVDKSLVLVREGREEEVRYRILEPVRQYGMEMLAESGEKEIMIERYRKYFLTLAVEAETRLTGKEQKEWMNRLEEEKNNLRAVMDLCDPSQGLRMAVALSQFWNVRGYLSEGRERLSHFLEKPTTDSEVPVLAKALWAAGNLAILQGDFEPARLLLEKGLNFFRQLHDERWCALALLKLNIAASRQGRNEESQRLAEESLALFRKIGDEAGIAQCLNSLANNAIEKGDNKQARALYEESLSLCKKIDCREFIPLLLNNLGNLHEFEGDLARARSYYEKYLEMATEMGNKREMTFAFISLGNNSLKQGDYVLAEDLLNGSLELLRQLKDKLFTVFCLEAHAELAFRQKRIARAARLTGKAMALRKAIGSPLSQSDLSEHARFLETLREELGSAVFEEALKQGEEMGFEEAVEYGLSDG